MSKEKQNFKKDRSNYIDFCLAFINFLIIVIQLIVFHKNIFISIFGLVISSILIVLTAYEFIKSNPFIIYYCFVFLISSISFLITSVTINPMLGLSYILVGVNIINYFKLLRYIHSDSQIVGASVFYKYGGKISNVEHKYQQVGYIDAELESKAKQQRLKLKKQYNSGKILKYSLILGFGLIIVSIFFFLSYFSYLIFT